MNGKRCSLYDEIEYPKNQTLKEKNLFQPLWKTQFPPAVTAPGGDGVLLAITRRNGRMMVLGNVLVPEIHFPHIFSITRPLSMSTVLHCQTYTASLKATSVGVTKTDIFGQSIVKLN